MPSTTRRVLVTTAAFGTVATATGMSLPARADDHTERELGAAHRRKLQRDLQRTRLYVASYDFAKHSALSENGIDRALDRLTEESLIDDKDRGILGSIVHFLFDTEIKDVETLLERTRDSIASGLGDVADSIAGVVENGADHVAEFLSGLDYRKTVTGIAHGMQGAIQGALAGAALGGSLGGVAGAVAGAILGAAAAMVIGYYETEC